MNELDAALCPLCDAEAYLIQYRFQGEVLFNPKVLESLARRRDVVAHVFKPGQWVFKSKAVPHLTRALPLAGYRVPWRRR